MQHFDRDEFAADELELLGVEPFPKMLEEQEEWDFADGLVSPKKPKDGILTDEMRLVGRPIAQKWEDDAVEMPYANLAEYTMIPDFSGGDSTVNTQGS